GTGEYMYRGAAVTFVAFLFTFQTLQARTYPSSPPNYDIDINRSYDHIFGVFEHVPGYIEPNFAEAINLPSPLYNPVYSTYEIVVIVRKTDAPTEGTDLVEKGQRARI